ncbi:MAG TPA: ATP-binding cassette domain-containing protein [Verrucomicrobiae bacterium]|nr:ATP-binding cassette domain-containing protein [Verrucomicrobiae bacterium]
MIQIQDLRKSFNGTQVLCGVDFEIQDSETVVIIGRSGGGKSVLLKHLCGLLQPDAGRVIVDGVDIEPLSEGAMTPIRKRFGVLFQGAALFDSMTVFENVAFPLREERKFSEEEIASRVEQALNIVDLAKAKDKKPAELSGGMKKRAALARAVVAQPKYVLYDEPTTGLDPVLADNINHLVLRMRDHFHVTSIAVTHDMVSAYKIADRIAMLHEGRIHAVGTPAEIQATTDPVVRQFITGTGEIQQEVRRGAETIR